MQRLVLAVLAAFALVADAPAFAGEEEGCKNCPSHKKEMAQATEKKPGDKDAKACSCAKGECKCAEGCKCECSHCHKDAKKDEKKTT